jgi:hypothetical protein
VQRKESGRFLKKAAQKLLLCGVMGGVGDNAHGRLLFVHKKKPSPSLAN